MSIMLNFPHFIGNGILEDDVSFIHTPYHDVSIFFIIYTIS
ncbi:hypothetical protein bthur0001_29280 [Bacillus thuringiensis serovar tochigiensis BGSC 4Y1]|nr:hypothetical protein bcere0001_28370 [Bacillus cereus m1293]EEM21931.1 hypothetical protein bthur0001_29280 [Bacillus thuringiensis serovar tochigiensis BGSC 4Y1]